MGKMKVSVDLPIQQYDYLISALTEYDVVLSELYDDGSVVGNQVQCFVRMCRAVTHNRWEPKACLAGLAKPDQRGRIAQSA